ncbi:hypothetical protein L1887_09998 [Cichorium endivia]|nr:hypothetical protein L1887_09998 [Cichorium endivia]
MKKTPVFYRGKASNGSKTNWIIHEYKLAKPIEMFLKKKERKIGNNDIKGARFEEVGPIFYGFMAGVPRTGDMNSKPTAASLHRRLVQVGLQMLLP